MRRSADPLARPTLTDMDPRVRSHLDSHLGTISTAAVTRLGLSSNALRSMVAAGQLVQVARGAYADGALLASADQHEAHRIRTRAIVLSRAGSIAASHQSAALLHGLWVLRDDLDRVRVVHTSSRANTRSYSSYTVHRSPGGEALDRLGMIRVVIPAVAVLGTAVLLGVRSGVMAADSALRSKLTTQSELATWLGRMAGVPGVDSARYAVEHSSPLSGSAGESLLRLVLIGLGIEFLEQHPIRLDGWTAYVDFYLPRLGVVVEFDGAVKYDGPDGRRNLLAEKRREDQIRALGHGFARIEWSDLFHVRRIRAKINAAVASRRP